MTKTPLADAVKSYALQNQTRFHMPGHKGCDAGLFSASFCQYDVTELSETDNLLSPTGCIREAQALCARAAGANCSFFTTGGSTAGILAMFKAVLKSGDRVIVDRGCHISVYAALAVSGGVPVYVRGDFNASLGAFCPPTLSEIEKKFRENPSVRAVFITSPNAFGITAPLSEIAAFCRKNNLYLLVDEAHGAHFAFAPDCPPTALSQGADLCVQSYHKTLPALTGAAVLHVGSPALGARADAALRLFQSTSPSYLLLASIDSARAAAEESAEKWASLGRVIRENAPPNLLPTSDPYRLVVLCDGHRTAKMLEKANIVPEMTGSHGAVFIVTMADTPDAVKKLLALAKTFPASCAPAMLPPPCPMRMTPSMVFDALHETVPVKEAAGRISAKAVFRYPPGTAVLAPGEEITEDMRTYLVEHEDMPSQIEVIKKHTM